MFEYLDQIDSLSESSACDLLLQFYSGDEEYFYKIELNDGTHTIPLATKPQWIVQQNEINNTLGKLAPKKSSNFDEYFLTSYRKNLARSTNRELNIWNGNVYRLVQVNENKIKFAFEVTDYYSYLYDCFRLAVETYDTVVQGNYTGAELESHLPIRSEAARDIPSLMEFQQRYCKLGVVTMVVLNPSDSPILTIFHRRSESVVEHPNKFHIGPAGSFEPRDDVEFRDGYDLQSLVVREFNEEILSDMSDREAKIDLSEALEDNHADLCVTGFGVELLRGQPELTTLLMIGNELSDQILHNISPNWEFKSQSNSGQIIHKVDDPQLVRKAVSKDAVPAAALAIFQGLRTLEEKYGRSLSVDFKIPNP